MKLFVTLLLLLLTLHADYIIKYKFGKDATMTFFYKNPHISKLVFQSKDGKSEIYNIKGKQYIAVYEQGHLVTLIDFDQMKQQMQSMGIDLNAMMQQSQKSKPKISIKKSGKYKKVAGMKGEVWIVSRNENGKRVTETVVVTKNPSFAKASKLMFESFASMNQMDPSSQNSHDYSYLNGYGLLESDSGMILQSFQEKKVAKKEYTLPRLQ